MVTPITHSQGGYRFGKTEELVLGLPPGNDARDVPVTRAIEYTASAEGKRIWSLVERLDVSVPDCESYRLGALARLSIRADDLHVIAEKGGHLNSESYKAQQAQLYESALRLVENTAPRAADE